MNYLIISNYYRLTKDIISELCHPNIEIIKFDLNIDEIDAVIAEASYNSLFDSNKNIVVYNSDVLFKSKIDEKTQELVINYLMHPNPNNTIIFISNEKEDNRKKIVKILKDQKHVFDYYKISYNDNLKMIKKFIKKNNYNITDDIINYIIKSCNNNYDLICNEIEKAVLCFGDSITLTEAKKIISTNLSDNIFKYIDELINKDLDKASKLLNELKIFKVDPAIILIMLAKEFKYMLFYKISNEYKIPINIAFKNDNLQDWQINKISNNSRKYSKKEIKSIISTIAKFDYKYKKGEITKPLVLDLLMLELLQ